MASTASAIINDVTEQLGDDPTSPGYFTQALMLGWLNRSLKRICADAENIKLQTFRSKVADQYQYTLPANFIKAVVVLVTDGSGKFYRLRRARLADIEHARYTVTSGDPAYYDVSTNAHATRSTGTITSGDNIHMVDTSKDFSQSPDQVFVGDIMTNETDDSEAIIDVVNGNRLDFTGGLQGGSDNLASASDTYRILSADVSLKQLVIHPAFSSSDATGTEGVKLLYVARHRVITQDHIDDQNDTLDLDEELEEALIFRMKFYGRQYEGDEQAAASEFSLFQNELRRAKIEVNRRSEEFVNTWAGIQNFSSPQTSGSSRTLPSWFGSY